MVNEKRFLSPVLTALVLSLTLGAVTVQAQTTSAKVTRIGQGDRIGTADQVALDSFKSAQNVVLVNGYGYADAVSATPLAKQLGAPILLTHGDTLESQVSSTITSLGAAKVYIVGGTGVVSQSIEDNLKSKYGAGQVERIAGTTDTTRMGTNAAVAEKVLSTSNQKTAVLVNGQDGYADSLSVASIAAQKGYPVLFANKTEVPDAVKNVITSKSLSIQAVGGSTVLPQAVVSSVGGTKVTSDSDTANRFATNLAVLKYFQNNGGLDFSNIYVAAGGAADDQFADALVASAAAAKTGSPVVLTGVGAGDTQIENANVYILSNASDNSNVTIVGGPASVSQDIQSTLENDDFEIIGVE
ncbi:cell wall-binding repeat-containing protein [Clostridium sp. JNZ X4-2]